jgi:hypothetical protein
MVTNELHKNNQIKTQSLPQVEDKPTYDKFDLDKSFLSGMGSVFNIFGNYYSFDDYLSEADDVKDLSSDWDKVGAALWNAMSY